MKVKQLELRTAWGKSGEGDFSFWQSLHPAQLEAFAPIVPWVPNHLPISSEDLSRHKSGLYYHLYSWNLIITHSAWARIDLILLSFSHSPIPPEAIVVVKNQGFSSDLALPL